MSPEIEFTEEVVTIWLKPSSAPNTIYTLRPNQAKSLKEAFISFLETGVPHFKTCAATTIQKEKRHESTKFDSTTTIDFSAVAVIDAAIQ
ncbi:MAG: hypothetical protein H7Z37_12045 [Pyrinomonadaceae bacterium]|nr:hypothetical protein [Pyrinomonadaceae bacterium]